MKKLSTMGELVLSAPQLQGGQVIGAVGVSGVKSQDDARIAKAGIAALVLRDPQ